jgi:hypothetical protein
MQEDKKMISADQESRKEWYQPRLSTFGTIADITRGCHDPKTHGHDDGFGLKAPPLNCAS